MDVDDGRSHGPGAVSLSRVIVFFRVYGHIGYLYLRNGGFCLLKERALELERRDVLNGFAIG